MKLISGENTYISVTDFTTRKMTNDERFECALARIKQGEGMKTVIHNVYQNRRQYNNSTTPAQRAELSSLRNEYMMNRPAAKYKMPPRFFVETTPERRKTVNDYCKANGLTVSRFINRGVAELLSRLVGDQHQ